ncbi:hypothetical protein BLOT_011639, partial [Blomia tropicalis]
EILRKQSLAFLYSLQLQHLKKEDLKTRRYNLKRMRGEILRKQSLATFFLFPTTAAIGSSKQSSSINRINKFKPVVDVLEQLQMSMMEIGGFSPNSNFIGSQGFITEIALATPKELQHDASTVPLDRITMDLGGTAAPLKHIAFIQCARVSCLGNCRFFSQSANFIVPQDFINEIDLATPKELLTAAYEMQHDASTVTMHQMELASQTSY